MTDPTHFVSDKVTDAGALPDPMPSAPPRSQWRDVWDQFTHHKGAMAGGIVFLIILLAVLANPIESARVFGLLLLDASGSALGTMGIYLDDTFGRGITLASLAASLLLWIAVPLAVAVAVLGRRDL